MGHLRLRRSASVCLLVAAGCAERPPEPLSVAGGTYVVRAGGDGSVSVERADGQPLLRRVFAEAWVRAPEGREPAVHRTIDGCARELRTVRESDALGTARRLELTCTGLAGAPDLVWVLSAYEDAPFLTARLTARNATGGELVLDRLVPAKLDAREGGALLLGAHPSTHRILEAGSMFAFEFFVDLVPGDRPAPLNAAMMAGFMGEQEGHSISNWSHAVHDLAGGGSLVAGSLDFESSSPMLNASFDPADAQPSEGRTPFTYWSGEYPYLPAGKPLAPGAAHSAGPLWVAPASREPLADLERYALAVKAHNRIRLWTERGPENRIPTGWNSWTGSGSSGGYGSDIDQAKMIANLEVMAREVRDFGGEWFQVDDGYQRAYGDWDWRPDRFPDGSAWMARQIEARGLLPGVWIAPFQADAHSQTHAAHAGDGWFAPGQPLLSGDKPILDLTHPDVLRWIEDRFRRIRAEGWRWVKTDFMYWALGAASFHDRTATREEAYRRGLAAIRAGLDKGALEAGGTPGDAFWLAVSMTGPHTGFADSLRPNLDTMPAWEREGEGQSRQMAQGFKPTVRTMARRFFLQNRVFQLNHDMLFFRSHADASVPRITREEARALLTAVALSGSVAKVGEKLVEMKPEWIADYRAALPVHGHAARPLDLFAREYPEVWHLRVVPADGLNTHGAGEPYDVVALFHWGANEDLSVNPYAPMADAPRAVSVDLAALGLDAPEGYVAREFWSGELAQARGHFSRVLAPHSVQVFALRPRRERPMYVGGNRHVLQGAHELRAESWSAAERRLTLTYDAAPGTAAVPFTHRLVFRVPAGFALAAAEVAGAGAVERTAAGERLEVSFTVDRRRPVDVTLRF